MFDIAAVSSIFDPRRQYRYLESTSVDAVYDRALGCSSKKTGEGADTSINRIDRSTGCVVVIINRNREHDANNNRAIGHSL